MGILKSRKVNHSPTSKKHPSDEQSKIELVRCNQNGENCNAQLFEINQKFIRSNQFRLEKEYQNSIHELVNAYHTTRELNHSNCRNCAELFRVTITKSLENLHEELKYMSTGVFGSKRYQSGYIMARDVLNDLKNGKNSR